MVEIEVSELATCHYLNISDGATLICSSCWNTYSLVEISKVGARLGSVWTAHRSLDGPCKIDERNAIWSSANSCPVELAHLNWVYRLHVDASVLCLVSVALFTRIQGISASDVLAVNSKAVATQI